MVELRLIEAVVLGPGKDGSKGEVVSVDKALAHHLLARGIAEPAPKAEPKQVKGRKRGNKSAD